MGGLRGGAGLRWFGGVCPAADAAQGELAFSTGLGFDFFFDEHGEGHAEVAGGDLVVENGGDAITEIVAGVAELGVSDKSFGAAQGDFGGHAGSID